MKTDVMIRMPIRYDMTGMALPQQVKTTGKTISKRLAARLYRYALDRLRLSGFQDVVTGWEPEAYTLDADNPVDDRTYCVRWVNPEGGYIEVIGIFISDGKPHLDHGFAIGDD